MSDIDIHLLREKIVREVEQWKEKTANHYTIEAEARWSEANYILGILDSLQQEQREVDLEEEISKFIRTYFTKPEYGEDFIAEVDWENSMRECAHHFYERKKQ